MVDPNANAHGFSMSEAKFDGDYLAAEPLSPDYEDDSPGDVEEQPVDDLTPDSIEENKDELIALLEKDELTPEQRRAVLDHYWPLPDGFPDKAQLDAWEAEYSKILIHRVAANEAYVVRALTRAEFKQYLEIIKKKFGLSEADASEVNMFQEELLVERCTLWPVVTAADIRGETQNPDGSKRPIHKIGLAGTVSVLAFDIQSLSNLIVDDNVGPLEEV